MAMSKDEKISATKKALKLKHPDWDDNKIAQAAFAIVNGEKETVSKEIIVGENVRLFLNSDIVLTE